MDTINDRIQTIVNVYFDGNQAKFAKYVGLPKGSISNYLNKGSKPNVDLLEKIVNLLDVDAYWLLTGKGSMKKNLEELSETEWQRRTQLANENKVNRVLSLCHGLVDNYRQQNNTIRQLATLLDQLDNNNKHNAETMSETQPKTNTTTEM